MLMLVSLFAVSQSTSSASGSYKELERSTFATLQRPVGLAWTGSGFIASDRANLSSATLVTISVDGKNVTPFVPSFSTKNGTMEDYIAVSNGTAGFPSGDYFILSFDSIYEINPQNNAAELFSTPVKNQQLSYIAFDTVGTWGYDLLVLYQNGMISSINSTGNATEIANVGPGQNPENLVVAPSGFGSFSGDLIVSEEIGNHSIIAIPPSNRTDHITLTKFPTEAPERVLEIQKNSDLYTAKYDQGVIEKYPATDFSNFSSSSLLVITEGESGQNGSMDVLSAVGNNVSVTTILVENDAHFEGAIFVPPNESGSSTSSTTTSTSQVSATQTATSDQTTLITIAIILLVAAIGATYASIRMRK